MMHAYTNRVSCMVNGNKSEVILVFSQQTPSLDENGDPGPLKSEEVAGLAMTMDFAKDLKQILENMMK